MRSGLFNLTLLPVHLDDPKKRTKIERKEFFVYCGSSTTATGPVRNFRYGTRVVVLVPYNVSVQVRSIIRTEIPNIMSSTTGTTVV